MCENECHETHWACFCEYETEHKATSLQSSKRETKYRGDHQRVSLLIEEKGVHGALRSPGKGI